MIAWLLFAFIPVDRVALDRVDVAELNHVCCEFSGLETGVYWNWWEWHGGIGDYVVVDWRREIDAPRPTDGVQEFWDAKTKTKRKIESKVFSETWTFYDRETFDRERLPENRRRKLNCR